MARIGVSALGLLCAMFAAAVGVSPASGQIDPPPGPVAPSMKRLDQIDPRRTVGSLPGSADAVHVISQPGVYVLTADVVGQPGRHGILITCDGDVSLDLNGFSVVGVPGSLHGVYRPASGSGQASGRRSFAMPHVFDEKGRISNWGGDGLHIASVDECSVAGVSISDCDGAALVLTMRHDAIHAAIQNVRAVSCGGGGVLVDHLAPQGTLSGGGPGKIGISNCSVLACGGDGIRVRCPTTAVCDVSIERCVVMNCPGDGVTVEAYAAGGGGGAGKVQMQDVRVSGCRNGIRCECQQGWTGSSCDIARCTVERCDEDGIRLVDVLTSTVGGVDVLRCGGVGLRAMSTGGAISGALVVASKKGYDSYQELACGIMGQRLAHVSIDGVLCSNCSEDGIRMTDVTLCDLASFDVSFCGGHGVSARKVVKFKAGAELAGTVNTGKGARVDACGGSGVYMLDCPDVSTRGLHVSACVDGPGVLHAFGVPPDLFTAAHEAAHVVQCRGGIQCDCPNHPMSVDFACVSCTLSDNFGAGLSVVCPGSGPVRCVLDRCVCSGNASRGVDLGFGSASTVDCSCLHLRCMHNGSDGISVSSTDPASTLLHAMVSLDSCVCSGNVGSGARCRCPLDGRRCVFSQNGGNGVDVAVASPFDSAGSMQDSTFHRNAGNGLHCDRGRYQSMRCDSSDNGGHGMHLTEGCLIVDSCVCNRNGGDGLRVVGTLTATGSAMRRNGGSGAVCSGGQCVCRDCVYELNGASAGVTAAGAAFFDCTSVSLLRCVASNNTGPGLLCASSSGVACAWSSVECVCSSNTGDGIRLSNTFGAQVLRCVCSNNGDWGVRCGTDSLGGKVEACSCTGNGGGVLVQGQNNLVISNTSSFGPLGAIVVAGNNAVGRIIDAGSLNAGDCDGRANLVH